MASLAFGSHLASISLSWNSDIIFFALKYQYLEHEVIISLKMFELMKKFRCKLKKEQVFFNIELELTHNIRWYIVL